jgi:hypothetical protein
MFDRVQNLNVNRLSEGEQSSSFMIHFGQGLELRITNGQTFHCPFCFLIKVAVCLYLMKAHSLSIPNNLDVVISYLKVALGNIVSC